MILRRTAIVTAVLGLGAVGAAYAAQADPGTAAGLSSTSRVLAIVVHPTRLLFVTPTGVSSSFPTGQLQPGDRVLGTDDIRQGASTIGVDYEVCTVSFGLNAVCDDTVILKGKGDLRVGWTFKWPSSGTAGPKAFDGIVLGGTGAYRNAAGVFHAVELPNNDLRIVARINT
ncbi:MAG: hypothetical protein WB565_14820 [Acidimicrobiales bacterium]